MHLQIYYYEQYFGMPLKNIHRELFFMTPGNDIRAVIIISHTIWLSFLFTSLCHYNLISYFIKHMCELILGSYYSVATSAKCNFKTVTKSSTSIIYFYTIPLTALETIHIYAKCRRSHVFCMSDYR